MKPVTRGYLSNRFAGLWLPGMIIAIVATVSLTGCGGASALDKGGYAYAEPDPVCPPGAVPVCEARWEDRTGESRLGSCACEAVPAYLRSAETGVLGRLRHP